MVRKLLCGILVAVFLAPAFVVAADYVEVKQATVEYSKC